MRAKHIIAALLCIVTMLAGWHDGRIFLPLLPYMIAAGRHIVADSKRALELSREVDDG